MPTQELDVREVPKCAVDRRLAIGVELRRIVTVERRFGVGPVEVAEPRRFRRTPARPLMGLPRLRSA